MDFGRSHEGGAAWSHAWDQDQEISMHGPPVGLGLFVAGVSESHADVKYIRILPAC